MIPLFVELVKTVIEKVEFYKDLTGEEKREIAVGVLNKAVDIPMLPEFMEERVFGLLVDVTVNLLNNFYFILLRSASAAMKPKEAHPPPSRIFR